MQSNKNRGNEGLSTNSVMTATQIAVYLITHCRSLKAFDSYMFGSTLEGIGHDIDILIIGPSGEALSVLKKEIEVAGRELPLDVLYMQPAEALETDFVKRAGCIKLTVLASKVDLARENVNYSYCKFTK